MILPSKPTRSLKHQLLISVGLPVAALILLVSGVAYRSARDEIDEVYDSQLITAANVLWLMNRDENHDDEPHVRLASKIIDLDTLDQKTLDEYAKWRWFRFWRNGKLIISSDNAPESVPPARKGFTNVMVGGRRWRIFTLDVPDENTVVEVAEKHTARMVIVRNIILGLLGPLLLALPLIFLSVWKGIRWGLKDLQQFTQAIDQRSPDDLSKVDSEHAPLEILPLSHALNHLLQKLETSLQQERLFTDNAAHELRTPLATLGIQADVILQANDEQERAAMVQELNKGVRRASRMLDQLLTLARMRHQDIVRTPVNLYEQAREAIKLVYPAAWGKHIECALTGDERITAVSSAPMSAILLNNLLENSIKYSPPDSLISVCVNSDGTMSIIDQGPGIPESEREEVFNRFYRVPGNTEPGSGLGLAIVRVVAESLDIGVALFTPETGQGLGVRLSFPQV